VRKPAIVYIDQFLWVDLARRYLSSPKAPSSTDTPREILLAIEAGEVVCPFSDAHMVETSRRIDIRSRRDVIRTLVAFTRGWSLAPVTAVSPQELRHSLARLFGAPEPAPVVALGRGVPFALGRSGQLHEDLHMGEDEARAFEAMLDSPGALFQLLGGTDNDYIEPARSAIVEHARNAAEREEQSRPIQRRCSEAERRRAYADTLTRALQDELSAALGEMSRTVADLRAIGQEGLMQFWASVPTADVEIELVTARNKQWSRVVAGNDIADIDFLSVAIPYCDLVLTEPFWNQLAFQTGLARKYGTSMGTSLDSIPAFLQRLRSSE
jgi:hypothetical protein